jgi:hypothetical protein
MRRDSGSSFRSPPRARRALVGTLLAGTALLGAALVVGACGGYGYVGVGVGGGYYGGGPYYGGGGYYYAASPFPGKVEVQNLTDTTTPEHVVDFALARAGTGAFGPNLLPGPLPPGAAVDLADVPVGVYDGRADLELGDLVTWDGVAVPANDVTRFQVY